MRKAIAIIILSSTMGWAFGQKNNVQSASNSFKYKEYGEAKKYIDLAAAHPKTANAPKMWYYRGRIYLSIHEKKSSLDPEAITKSINSLMTCLDVDKSKMYADSSSVYLMNGAIQCFISGVHEYQAKEYTKASELYELVLKTLEYDKNKDLARNNVSEKTIYLNLYYAANASKDNVKSKKYLDKLIDLGYNDANIYLFMCQILLEENDTVNALAYIEKGRERFYDDKNLILQQVSLSIKMGKSDALLKRMTEDIEYDSGNPTLFLVRGILYEQNGNKEGAKKDYLEALELNPGFFVAAYNLGAMFYSEAVEILTAAKEIVDNDKYAKEKDKAIALFKEGIPHLEAALEIDPKDHDTAQRLVRMYARTGDTAKYDALKKKIESM
ncbi:MAG: tetratricopeptide repeat protein [Flavobacteriales bacterium]|nr:tetratricopeptide repeat protein [Flavobacteriales bacterium]